MTSDNEPPKPWDSFQIGPFWDSTKTSRGPAFAPPVSEDLRTERARLVVWGNTTSPRKAFSLIKTHCLWEEPAWKALGSSFARPKPCLDGRWARRYRLTNPEKGLGFGDRL